MRWDELLPAWVARLLADPELVDLLEGEGAIYPAQAARPVRIPSVEYLTVLDRESELFNPVGLQVDVFARGLDLEARIERRIRMLSHHDTRQDLDGERVWLRYLDSRTVDFPSDPGVVHRILDFELEAIRERYAHL